MAYNIKEITREKINGDSRSGCYIKVTDTIYYLCKNNQAMKNKEEIINVQFNPNKTIERNSSDELQAIGITSGTDEEYLNALSYKDLLDALTIERLD